MNDDHKQYSIQIQKNIYDSIMEECMFTKEINTILDETFRPALKTIEKQKHINYKFPDEAQEYLISYFNILNQVLLAFNSFLVKYLYALCEKNNIKYRQHL